MEILNGSSIKMSFKISTSFHIFWSRANFKWKACLDARHYRSLLKKIWNISKYGKSTFFLPLWLNTTLSSSIHLIPFFFHFKDCNLIFLKHQESCPKTPWVENAIGQKLAIWNWFFHQVKSLKSLIWLLNTLFLRVFASEHV